MSELRNIVQSNDLPDGVKAIVGPEVYQLMLKQASQPRLTIPKSIAKLIDTGDTKYIRWAYAEELIVSSDVVEDEWKAHEKREYEIVRRKALIQAYLAGKALGVDLVKVVEGE